MIKIKSKLLKTRKVRKHNVSGGFKLFGRFFGTSRPPTSVIPPNGVSPTLLPTGSIRTNLFKNSAARQAFFNNPTTKKNLFNSTIKKLNSPVIKSLTTKQKKNLIKHAERVDALKYAGKDKGIYQNFSTIQILRETRKKDKAFRKLQAQEKRLLSLPQDPKKRMIEIKAREPSLNTKHALLNSQIGVLNLKLSQPYRPIKPKVPMSLLPIPSGS
jgi:hypothetical protein